MFQFSKVVTSFFFFMQHLFWIKLILFYVNVVKQKPQKDFLDAASKYNTSFHFLLL